MGAFEVSLEMAAPPAAVWAILADYGAIATWNPVLVGSRLLTPNNGGVGSVRHCDIRGGGYTRERVVAWEDRTSLTYEIYETDRPMRHARNAFTVRAAGSGSVVTFRLDYALKMGPLGWVLDVLMARSKMQGAARKTLEGLKARAEGAPPLRPADPPVQR